MKKIIIGLGTTILIISLISIGVLVLFEQPKIETTDNQMNLTTEITLFKGNVNSVFVNTSKLSSNTSKQPYYFTVSQMENVYNSTEELNLAKKYLSNPQLDIYTSTAVKNIYGNNGSNERLVIGRGNTIKYYNTSFEIISTKNLMSNSTLESKAKSFIKNIRGKNSDVEIEEISTCYIYKGNTTTGEEQLIGYDYQRVVYRQYVNGYKVTGAKGEIMIEFGKDGSIEYYRDTTFSISNVNNFTHRIDDINTTLAKIANTTIMKGEDSYTVIDWNMVLHTTDVYGFSEVDLKWELKIKSNSRGTSLIYYV